MKDQNRDNLQLVIVTFGMIFLICVPLALIGCNTSPSTPVPKVVSETKVTVLAFIASWCEPCRFSLPTLIAIELKGVSVIILDIDKDSEWRKLAEKYKITSVPTFFVYVEGKKTTRTQDISVVVRIVKENIK